MYRCLKRGEPEQFAIDRQKCLVCYVPRVIINCYMYSNSKTIICACATCDDECFSLSSNSVLFPLLSEFFLSFPYSFYFQVVMQQEIFGEIQYSTYAVNPLWHG